MADDNTVHRCFMDGIDWEHHLEADAKGTRLFASVQSLKREKTCIEIGGCGVVEVEVRLIRWVEPQDLKWDHTNHAPDAVSTRKP